MWHIRSSVAERDVLPSRLTNPGVFVPGRGPALYQETLELVNCTVDGNACADDVATDGRARPQGPGVTPPCYFLRKVVYLVVYDAGKDFVFFVY